jgi:hypothetical protein
VSLTIANARAATLARATEGAADEATAAISATLIDKATLDVDFANALKLATVVPSTA